MEGHQAVVVSKVRSDAPYFDDDPAHFAEHWLLEMMAQSAAALSGLLHHSDGNPVPFGFLISVRDFTLHQAPPPRVGDTLYFYPHFEVSMRPVGHCAIKACDEQGRLLATGAMTFISQMEGGLPLDASL